MARSTIDFGIDLGTTNSCIAVQKSSEVEIIKNNEGHEVTPSAVWIDRKNRLRVGNQAKERYEHDRENAAIEFKLQMGKMNETVFKTSGRKMKPEELSAEILKSLKEDLRQHLGEELKAAVITVPAIFGLDSCKATKEAANLAGIELSLLLQEPIAATMAYELQSKTDNKFWLVYDLGGGTFDAAVIQVRDGKIKVVNHGGDMHLGGKNIDWKIVDEILIPELKRKYRFDDFHRGNLKNRGAIAKLKTYAEKAKIELSKYETAEIFNDYLCKDDRGREVGIDYELRRENVEKLMESIVTRTINICRKVLAEKSLGTGDIEKILLVGGATLSPYLRDKLLDPINGLGIPLEFSMDPLTVVAKGAALFAGAERMELPKKYLVSRLREGKFTIFFPEWKFKGEDPEPLIGGMVKAPAGESLHDLSLEFTNSSMKPPWRSGRVEVSSDGTFMTSLFAENEKDNSFEVKLFNGSGNFCNIATDPESLNYNMKGLISDCFPLISSIGVALANNEMVWFIKKGKDLPASHREPLRTVKDVRPGQKGDVLRIPVMEGENPRADRNRCVGKLEVHSHKIAKNLHAGSEVEVLIKIDKSRLILTEAFIPCLDMTFDEVITLVPPKAEPEKLRKEFEKEKERLDKAKSDTYEMGDPKAKKVLKRIDEENILLDVETALSTLKTNPDAAEKCQCRIRDLKSAIDEVEKALELPRLLKNAKDAINTTRSIINNPIFKATLKEITNFKILERETKKAMEGDDPDLLKVKIEELERLKYQVLLRNDVIWMVIFKQLVSNKSNLTNQSLAETYISQGKQALNNNNMSGLQEAVRKLADLQPGGSGGISDMIMSSMTR